jgi:hypothetical protein
MSLYLVFRFAFAGRLGATVSGAAPADGYFRSSSINPNLNTSEIANLSPRLADAAA